MWLDKDSANIFIRNAASYKVECSADRLDFPETTVILAHAEPKDLWKCMNKFGAVQALAYPAAAAGFFTSALQPEEQAEWVSELRSRIQLPENPSHYIAILDSGISLNHPLIQPFLNSSDRYTADPSWSLGDLKGHGTNMAGWALYGDLTNALAGSTAIAIPYRLESIKILPDIKPSSPCLPGSITRRGIEAAEIHNAERQRIFAMAVTSDDDYPHDGAPTSWSAEMDQLAYDGGKTPRLILISAGNSDSNKFRTMDYLSVCDTKENEIESPAQAWNLITVGGYTEKVTPLPPHEGHSLAPFQDLSPLSRTASWDSVWPIKPDIVMEAGNLRLTNMPPAYDYDALSLLTTAHDYPAHSFDCGIGTSPATALAAKEIAELWHDYPQLWPESLRALYVSSARWTPQMESHLPVNPNKGNYALLFKRYGYGVPDLARAKQSASNALTMIIEETITPYKKHKNGIQLNEMKFFKLPWPVKELRKLGSANITLRVALSSFISPNLRESAWKRKYGYASHNLRFALNRLDEGEYEFSKRINEAEREKTYDSNKQNHNDDGWRFGINLRDVGSLQIDEITCKASDLAQRNLLAVYPISGWGKTSKKLFEFLPRKIRFSLIVEIDAGEIEANLYAEVQNAIQNILRTSSRVELVNDGAVVTV